MSYEIVYQSLKYSVGVIVGACYPELARIKNDKTLIFYNSSVALAGNTYLTNTVNIRSVIELNTICRNFLQPCCTHNLSWPVKFSKLSKDPSVQCVYMRRLS